MYDSATNRIFESTGLNKQSLIRSFTLNDTSSSAENFEILYQNPDYQFGEGLAKVGERYFQLTWKNGIMNVLKEKEGKLELERMAAIPRDDDCVVPEGWGMTSDGKFLYMTDGTNRIFKIDPEKLHDFDEEKLIQQYTKDNCTDYPKFDKIYYVTDPSTDHKLKNLNELEMVGNHFYCNIWDPYIGGSYIAKLKFENESISLVKIYDLCSLKENACNYLKKQKANSSCRSLNEFNGIAFDDVKKQFIVTGKNWPKVYRITFDDQEES
jgi:glutaminyl-peptide cyclotransferase